MQKFSGEIAFREFVNGSRAEVVGRSSLVHRPLNHRGEPGWGLGLGGSLDCALGWNTKIPRLRVGLEC